MLSALIVSGLAVSLKGVRLFDTDNFNNGHLTVEDCVNARLMTGQKARGLS